MRLTARQSQSRSRLDLPWSPPDLPRSPPQELDEAERSIKELIEHLDHGIGQVIDSLKANGQWENTLTIFVSDNGGQLNVGGNCGNLRGGKQDMYEGGLKVPACAVWPGVIEAGKASEFPFLTMDLFPTTIEAAGGKSPGGIEGKSILPLLKTGTQKAFERDVFFTRREGNQKYMGDSSWAMRRGPWKLLKNVPDGPWELYNLDGDPLEATDLRKKNPQKFNELSKAMRAQIQRGGSVPWQRPE